MKRLLTALLLLCPMLALAQDRYDIPQTGTKIGLTRTGINSNFLFLFISGTNSFRTAVQKGSNINFIGKSPTNAAQLDYCLTNSSGGADGNTPQGPWTNWMAAATWGVSNAGTYHLADTNTILVMLGTNRLEVQGGATTPTNLAWNGSSLINPAGSGGGGAYAYQGTNNIAPTNANGNTIAANAISSRIGGGTNNVIGGTRFSTIAGGRNNTISNMDTFGEAFIGGGSGNTIGGTPSEPGWWGVIGGGRNNVMNGDRSAILGGENNVVGDQAFYSSILAAFACSVAAGASYNSILGGANCTIGANSSHCTLGGEQNIIGANIGRNTMPGGSNNQIYNPADYATISGGGANYVVADYTTIGGGQANTIEAGATHSTVGGGNGNNIGASATYATVAGGQDCDVAASATHALAAGRRAGANHPGAFVWADSTDADFDSTTNNQFSIRASGGVNLAVTGADFIVDSVWHQTITRIVTNANVFLFTSHASMPSKLWDIGSNVWYVANGLSSTNWHREDGAGGL